MSKHGSEVYVSKWVRAGTGWAWFKSSKTIVSPLKDTNITDKGYLYHLVRVNNLDKEVPFVDSLSIMNEFPYVFLKDLPAVFP